MLGIKIFGGLADQIIYAIVIFFFIQLLKYLIKKYVHKLFDNLANKTESTFDNEIFDILRKPIDVLFLVLGIKFAIDVLPFSLGFMSYVDEAIRSAFALIIFWTIYELVKPVSNLIQKFTSKFGKNISNDIANLIKKVLQIVVLAIGFATILRGWGYNINGLIASLGLVGMAFALAAKDTAANLFGSLVIFTDKPFKVGEWINTPNVDGIVEEVGIRSTKIRTFAQGLVTVPNAILANSAILNWSKMGKRRIKMQIGLTYNTSPAQMQKILDEIRLMLKNHPDVHKDVIYVYFTDFLDSSLGVFCYYFTKTTNWQKYMQVKEDTNLKIMQIIENNKSGFAFPSRSVYLEKHRENYKELG